MSELKKAPWNTATGAAEARALTEALNAVIDRVNELEQQLYRFNVNASTSYGKLEEKHRDLMKTLAITRSHMHEAEVKHTGHTHQYAIGYNNEVQTRTTKPPEDTNEQA
jgi:hypothetical protein